MKIVFLIGNQPNHKFLVQSIKQNFNVANIIVENKTNRPKKGFNSIVQKIYQKLFLGKLNQTWKKLMDQYKNQIHLKEKDFLYVSNINEIDVDHEVNQYQPDLVIVSGTSLISNKTLSNIKTKVGIINLHTGLSPYIKGGPNCTNWCLALNKFEYIGNTVMWIDKGIDSGNIIYSQRTPFKQKCYSLYEIHLTVMTHAHSMVNEVCYVANKNPDLLPNIEQQTLGKGKTFYTKEWTNDKKKKAIKNVANFNKFKQRYCDESETNEVHLKN